jgi:hypothetical protein
VPVYTRQLPVSQKSCKGLPQEKDISLADEAQYFEGIRLCLLGVSARSAAAQRVPGKVARLAMLAIVFVNIFSQAERRPGPVDQA